jgi:hypothetical protein
MLGSAHPEPAIQNPEAEMHLRSALTLIALFAFPAFTLAQDGSAPGGHVCESTKACPQGQVMDAETKTCTEVSS